MTEKEKMECQKLYDANYDKELELERLKCKSLCQKYNNLPGSYYNELPRDYNSMKYIVELLCHRNTSTEKLEVKNGKLTDT